MVGLHYCLFLCESYSSIFFPLIYFREGEEKDVRDVSIGGGGASWLGPDIEFATLRYEGWYSSH